MMLFLYRLITNMLAIVKKLFLNFNEKMIILFEHKLFRLWEGYKKEMLLLSIYKTILIKLATLSLRCSSF